MKQLYINVMVILFLMPLMSEAQVKYASRVTGWSTQYTPGNWGAIQAAGAPDIISCGDNVLAWAPSSGDSRREWLELEYDNPEPINRVLIYETFAPGAVDTVYVLNPQTQLFEKVYEGNVTPGAPCPRVFTVSFPVTAFPVSKIRIAINSPAVSDYNEIDAVGVAYVSNGGSIAGDQDVCGSYTIAAFTSMEPAFGGDAGVVYQWQDSAANGAWNNIAGAQQLTYQAQSVTENRWFRRVATLGANTAISNQLKLNFVESGSPSVFPDNAWNFYAFQSTSLDLSSAIYKGYYSRAVLNFNTQHDWAAGAAPNSATGYKGCTMKVENFVVSARRKGFPPGNYLLQVNDYRGVLRVYVNGTELPALPCCTGSLSLGLLDENSGVELRLYDAGSLAYLNLEFTVAALNGGDIGEAQTICKNETPASLVNNIAAYGGAAPASITYQWQDSVMNGNWTNISNATGSAYQPAALAVNTWFRRKATDNTNAIAYSDIVLITTSTVQGDTTVYGNHSWIGYVFNGNDITLATNTYRGYYTFTGLNINTGSNWPASGAVSSGAGYQGCPSAFDNFVLSMRRQGFVPGVYNFRIDAADDQLMILVDGVVKYTGSVGLISLGSLDANSKVEIRLRELTGEARLVGSIYAVEESISALSLGICLGFTMNNVKGTDWNYFVDASGKTVAAVYPNGNDLGTVTLYAKHYGVGTAGIPTYPQSQKKFMSRYFELRSTNYPNNNFPSPVKVRFFYLNSDLNDYATAVGKPGLTMQQLGIAHYNGVNEDCEMSNNSGAQELLQTPVSGGFSANGFYLETSTNSFSEFGTADGVLLPVRLTAFRAELANGHVKLNWSTAQEIENKGFEILRSTDGRLWDKIGWIDGHGNTSWPQHYTFTDAAPASGKNFYRLRQLDLDGNFSFSDIAGVTIGYVTTLKLSPNPVEHILYIEYDTRKTVSLKIMDLQGRVIWQQQGRGANSLLAVPVQQFTKGMYLLETTDDTGHRQSLKFLKK